MKHPRKKPVTVGIWGIGRAGWGMHVPEIGRHADHFKIVAACDVEADRVRRMEEACHCRGYTDGAAFLADPGVELVTVAVRSPEHTAYALRALAAGKSVFLEKPIALCYADALKLKKAAAKYPGKLFCRHNRRFEPAFQHIREIMKSGLLGEVYEIKLCRHGFDRRDDWQTIIDCGGGQLNNWGPHLLDHALQFLDSPVKEVWRDLKKIAAVGDAEDHLKVILKGENGRVVDIEISGGVALPGPVYTVYGTRGALISDNEQDLRMRYLDPAQKLPKRQARRESPPLTGSFGSGETLRWRRQTIMVEPASGCTDPDNIWLPLYRSIREKQPFPITIDEAVEVVRVAELIKKGTPFARQ
ncbi:MAG: Gfo/Idh/MocA family oxidoreductase [Lentisphaeria bacterium]